MTLLRDRYAAHSMLVDDLLDQSRLLHVVRKTAQKAGGRFALLRRADRLLHAGHLAVEDARAGMLLGVLHEARLQACERVELLFDEQFIGTVDALGADQLCLFYISC